MATMMRATSNEEEEKQKWKPEEKKKVIVIRDRIYDKMAQKRHTIMIDMLPMAPKDPKTCAKKSPKPKSPIEKFPIPSPIEKVTSPTFKTSKKNMKKVYAPLMAQCMKIAKSNSCG